MAKFEDMIPTVQGLRMEAEAHTGKTLLFTRIEVGDGAITDQNIPDITALISPKMTIPIAKAQQKEAGHFLIDFTIDNSELEVGFFAREIGVYAKVGEEGVEKLYGYSTAGTYTSYLPDKSIPMSAITARLDISIGAATEVGYVTDETLVRVTMEQLHDAIQEHNEDITAHSDFTAATGSAAGKRGMVPAPAQGDHNRCLRGDGQWADVLTPDMINAINGVAGLDNKKKLLSALYDFASAAEAKAGTDTTKPINASGVAQAITALAGNAVIVDSLLATNGYVKFSNGLILQWGNGTITSNGSINVTLPLPLSSRAYFVVALPRTNISDETAYALKYNDAVSDNTNIVISSNVSSAPAFCYVAIGV